MTAVTTFFMPGTDRWFYRSVFVLCHVLICVLAACSPAIADNGSEAKPAPERFKDLRTEYFALARRDPTVGDREQWKRISDSLEALLEAPNPQTTDELTPDAGFEPPAARARVVFLSARVAEQIYRAHRDAPALEIALRRYHEVTHSYPEDSFADDALFALAELKREAENDVAAARVLFEKLLVRYPKSDLLSETRIRLARLPSASPQDASGQGPLLEQTEQNKPPKKQPEKRTRFFSWFERESVDEQADASSHSGDMLPLAQKLKPGLTIVIDPGHGGEEEGAAGVGNVLEKDIVLVLSREIERRLTERLGVNAILTRVKDVTLPLADRTRIANESNADLFISVHTNASKSKTASGIETYYLDTTNDKASLRLAERENASAISPGTDLGFIISDLIQNAKLGDSISLAHKIHDSLVRRVKSVYPDTKDLGVKKAPFYVLVGAHMPCVLLEVSFIDHKVEGYRLLDPSYQLLIADAVFEGIVDYIEGRPELMRPS